MAYALTPAPKFIAWDVEGNPLSGGKVYVYAAGTSTPVNTFSDSSGTVNSNPVILDSAGRATVYLTAGSNYKFVVKDENDVEQFTQDNISVSSGGGSGPTGTEGSVLFFAADGTVTEDNTNLFFSNSTKRLRVGTQATLFSNANGSLGFGANAGDSLTSGSRNFVAGNNAGTALTTGADNIAIGDAALQAAVVCTENIAIGTGAMGAAVVTGGDNVAIGAGLLEDCTSGQGNTAIGSNGTMSGLTTGTLNIALGYSCMRAAVTGYMNIGIGYIALDNLVDGEYNCALGESALNALVSGDHNFAYGLTALVTEVTGSNNIAIGNQALNDQDGVSGNIGIGAQALTTTDAAGCTGVGYQVLQDAAGASNTGLGYQAGLTVTTGIQGTFIGRDADGTAGGDNQTSLGFDATCTGANQVTLGNASVATLRCQQTTITALSDERDKTDIQDIPYGLAFINSLRPRQFVWNARDGSQVGVKDVGFIAQELQEVDTEYLRLVYDVNPERLEASAARAFPALVKAIQELSQQLEDLKARCACG